MTVNVVTLLFMLLGNRGPRALLVIFWILQWFKLCLAKLTLILFSRLTSKCFLSEDFECKTTVQLGHWISSCLRWVVACWLTGWDWPLFWRSCHTHGTDMMHYHVSSDELPGSSLTQSFHRQSTEFPSYEEPIKEIFILIVLNLVWICLPSGCYFYHFLHVLKFT